MKKPFLFAFGFLLVILGMALVLHYWPAVVTLFQGFVPPALAVAGLILMFAATIRQ